LKCLFQINLHKSKLARVTFSYLAQAQPACTAPKKTHNFYTSHKTWRPHRRKNATQIDQIFTKQKILFLMTMKPVMPKTVILPNQSKSRLNLFFSLPNFASFLWLLIAHLWLPTTYTGRSSRLGRQMGPKNSPHMYIRSHGTPKSIHLYLHTHTPHHHSKQTGILKQIISLSPYYVVTQ